VKPIHYTELVRYILQTTFDRWPSIFWYTLFYHEPPDRLRLVEYRSSLLKTFITPLDNEEWLIHWARSKGYIDAEGEQQALAAWTLHLME